MASKPADVKRLWGKAGGKCSICRNEVTSVGSEGTLGEMAHIVARSVDGPRGRSVLDMTERDSYSNLILLCPNHHAEVDADEVTYSIESLYRIKSEHETWVQRMLDAGQLPPTDLDTSHFITERVRKLQSTPSQAWCFVSLTPLVLAQDVIDPLRGKASGVIQSHRFPAYLSLPLGVHPNPYRLEPNSTGLIAEDFHRVADGVAYAIECHRSGHIETTILLDEALSRTTPDILLAMNFRRPEGFSESRRASCERILEYFILAEVLVSQLQLLSQIWEVADLPFRDMSLTVALTGVRRVCLLVKKNGRESWIGRPADEDAIVFTEVYSRGTTTEELARSPLRRLANSFGLELLEAFDSGGDLVAPARLRNIPH